MVVEEITMEDFASSLDRVLILPSGTVEEHGGHLPLSTDTMVAWAVAKEVERRVPVLLAPPIHYGVCTSTAMHPGTIGIGFDTMRAVVRDILRSGFDKGLRRFLILSGHGGGSHLTAIKEACEDIVRNLEGIKVATLCLYDLLSGEEGIKETENDSHAGEVETSLVLYIREDLVRGRSPEEYPEFPRPFIVRDKVRYWRGGVWGNPQKASKEKGKRVFQIMVEKVVGLVRAFEKEY